MPKEKKRASSCELLEDLMCTRTHTSIEKRGRRRGFVCWGPSEKGAKVNARDTQQETHAHTTPFFLFFFRCAVQWFKPPKLCVCVLLASACRVTRCTFELLQPSCSSCCCCSAAALFLSIQDCLVDLCCIISNFRSRTFRRVILVKCSVPPFIPFTNACRESSSKQNKTGSTDI